MDFMTAVKTCFSKYVTFEGRAPRSEYWWFTLFNVVGQVVLLFVYEPLSMLFALAVLLPGLTVTARRLHDIDRSGWWMLIVLIPIVGWLIMLYWEVQKGTNGPNRFGHDPLGNAPDGDDDGYATSSIPSTGN